MTENTENTESPVYTYSDREAWLMAAVEAMRPWFVHVGFPLPVKVRVAVGFGPTGARQESAKILGVCLHSSVSEDGVNEIWVSPEGDSTDDMLGTLIHELIHAALDNEDGHRGKFRQCGELLGLTGSMMASVPGPGLMAQLITVVETLGLYPGARVSLDNFFAKVPVSPAGTPVPVHGGGRYPRVSSGPVKQGTRMIKVSCLDAECPCVGYTVRTTRTWLAIGAPKCPMGHSMTE